MTLHKICAIWKYIQDKKLWASRNKNFINYFVKFRGSQHNNIRNLHSYDIVANSDETGKIFHIKDQSLLNFITDYPYTDYIFDSPRVESIFLARGKKDCDFKNFTEFVNLTYDCKFNNSKSFAFRNEQTKNAICKYLTKKGMDDPEVVAYLSRSQSDLKIMEYIDYKTCWSEKTESIASYFKDKRRFNKLRKAGYSDCEILYALKRDELVAFFINSEHFNDSVICLTEEEKKKYAVQLARKYPDRYIASIPARHPLRLKLIKKEPYLVLELGENATSDERKTAIEEDWTIACGLDNKTKAEIDYADYLREQEENRKRAELEEEMRKKLVQADGRFFDFMQKRERKIAESRSKQQ